MLQVMEISIENTTSTAPTAKILRLPDRAAHGVPDGEDLAPEGPELVRMAFEAAGGSCAQPVEMRPLARRLGLGPRAIANLVMRLQAERLVRVVSMANGLLRLTPEGVRAAESAASDPPQSAGSGPPDPATPTGTPRAGGGLAGTRVVPASPVVGRGALRELKGLLGPLKADLDRLDLAGALEEEQRSELAAEIRTIEAQLGSQRPKRRIVVAALESVGGIVGSAAGAAGGAAGSETESEGILRAINAFLGGLGLARPGGDLASENGSGTRRPEEESAATARAREAGDVRVRKRLHDGGWATGQAPDAGGPEVEGANGANVEAGKGAVSAVEDVGVGGDQAVREAEGTAGRSGDAADRARVQKAGAGRRVLRVVGEAGDILRTTLNERGEILDEEVVGHVADLPSEGEHADGGSRVASRAKDRSEPPIRPRVGRDGGVPKPRTPPPTGAEETVEGARYGPRTGPRPQEAGQWIEARGPGDPPARFLRRTVHGARESHDSLGRLGGRRVSAVSLASSADGDTLRSATAAGGRKLNKKRPVSDGESGTEDQRARTREQRERREKVSEGQNLQQQSQDEQYLQEARDFFGQSMGRIKGRTHSDSAQLKSIRQQLPEESQGQVQEMTDSYAQFEGVVDQAAQDAGVQDAMGEAAQQARQSADEAAEQDQEPADQAAAPVQEAAGGAADQAEEAAGQVAENLPPGYKAMGEPTTDEECNTIQRAEDEQGSAVDFTFDQEGNLMDEVPVDEEEENKATDEMAHNLPEGYEAVDEPTTAEPGNTVLLGRDEQGSFADSTYEQQGSLMSQAPVENGSGEEGEQPIKDFSSSDSNTTTVEKSKGEEGLLGGGLLSLDLLPPQESTTTTVEAGDFEDYYGPGKA